MKIDKTSSVQFGRKPTLAEFPVYTKALNDGLKLLNKEVGIIIHNNSAPSKPAFDTGIGSLLSLSTKSFFAPFLKSHAVSTIQQEPIYLRSKKDPSPYSPMSTSKSTYLIPLAKLTTAEYNHILPLHVFKSIKPENPTDEVDYKTVEKNYDFVLKIAHKNFLANKTPEYKDFKQKNYSKLEPNAIYEILADEHNEENWKLWPEEDKNLYDSHPDRLKYIRSIAKNEIDFHIFKQWLIERELAKTNKTLGLKIIADTPIAFTPAEVWQNKDLFLEDLVLGCPPDYFSKDGQRWGFAVLKPELIFNEDGSLGRAGKFLQKRYEDIFKNAPGGVRIDHFIGLIDPFVYQESSAKMTPHNSGRLYSSPKREILKQYHKKTDEEYGAILEKIVFPAAAKYGITKDRILCEDLGEVTEPVKKIMEKFQMSGLSVTQFGYSGYDAPERNVIMPGSHDNKSYLEYTDAFFAGDKNTFNYRTHTLGSDTVVPGENVDLYREELRKDKKKFLAASFAELFTSKAKKVQVFFTDFFGIPKTYNVPGSKENCWTLRLTGEFDKLYYDNLKNGTALNLPEAIARAIRQRGIQDKVLETLDHFSQVLKS